MLHVVAQKAVQACSTRPPRLLRTAIVQVRFKSAHRIKNPYAAPDSTRPDPRDVKEIMFDAGRQHQMREENERIRQLGPMFNEPRHNFGGRWPEERSRRELAKDKNELDTDFTYDEDHYEYRLGGTIVPSHLNHWIEEPYALKTPRDLKLYKRLQRLKKKEGQVEIRGNKPRPKEQVSRRMLHYNELYFSKLSDILAELPMKMSGANDTYSNLLSGAVMHITRVEVTKDLLRARVYWKCLPGRKDLVERELQLQTTKLRYLLTQSVKVKYSPELVFVYDEISQREIQTDAALRSASLELRRTKHEMGVGLVPGLESPEGPLPPEMVQRLEEIRIASEKARGAARAKVASASAIARKIGGTKRSKNTKELQEQFMRLRDELTRNQNKPTPITTDARMRQRRSEGIDFRTVEDDYVDTRELANEADVRPKSKKKAKTNSDAKRTPSQKAPKRNLNFEPQKELPKEDILDYSTLDGLFSKPAAKKSEPVEHRSAIRLVTGKKSSARG